MLKEWRGCFDDLFSVRNVSYGSHLLVFRARFLLGSTQVLAALPHLQKVVNVGHSVQFPCLRLFLHFLVLFCVSGIQFWVSACQNPVIGSSKLPDNNSFTKGLACGFWLPPSNNISAKGKTGLQSDTMWYDREYVTSHIGEIGVFCVRFLPLSPTIGYVWYPKCTANLHWVRVVIIEICINLCSVLWCFRRRMQIGPGCGHWVGCAIPSSGCHLRHIVRC